MKAKMNKLVLSLMLSLTMILAFSGSAYAAEARSITISIGTGGQYPADTLFYEDSTHSGLLNRVNVVNNPYYVDKGYYITETQSFAYQMVTYGAPGPNQYYINSGGFSGNIPLQSITVTPIYGPKGQVITHQYTLYYQGPLTRNVWVPNLVQHDNFTAQYTGVVLPK
ncbi:hypothetical protein ACFQZE_14475 [Paenibacillus sp. GCM10027627]|uniref:hypothetical protein n=1 Tax=unclassified Paenibacillus TaxID=185978 RepID=UPI0036423811